MGKERRGGTGRRPSFLAAPPGVSGPSNWIKETKAMKFHHVAAACVMSAALLAGVAPAGASLTLNSLTANALAPAGSSLGDLNGVTVEAVVLPGRR
jgi:hypothetical protein